MIILVENSAYSLLNMGDVAMLKVAVSRMKSFWPTANFHIITTAPDQIKELIPGTIPEDNFAIGYLKWSQLWNIFGPIHRFLPQTFESQLIVGIHLESCL